MPNPVMVRVFVRWGAALLICSSVVATGFWWVGDRPTPGMLRSDPAHVVSAGKSHRFASSPLSWNGLLTLTADERDRRSPLGEERDPGTRAGDASSSAGEIFVGHLPVDIAGLELSLHGAGNLQPAEVKVPFPMRDGRLGLALFHKRKLFAEDGSAWQWQGNVAGVAFSSVVITKWKGTLHGSIHAGRSGEFEWRQERSGKIGVYWFDPARLPDCEADGLMDAPEASVDLQDARTRVAQQAAAPLNGVKKFVDVVIGYNDQARVSIGGASSVPQDNAEIEAKILTAVADANIAYSESAIDLEMRVAWMGQIDYPYPATESFSRALDEIENESDGKGDELSQMKAKYQADFACLWLDSSATGGLATVITSAAGSHLAYSVVRVKNPSATFAHEIGHNMGCRHLRDGYPSTPSSWHPYSFAHKLVGPDGVAYVTVMASTEDQSRTGAVARILRFSNPNVLYAGRPTGVADTSDCARSIQETRHILESFRATPPLAPSISRSGQGVRVALEKAFVARTYSLWRSSDLTNWIKLGTYPTDDAGTVFRTDFNASKLPAAFYQWRLEP